MKLLSDMAESLQSRGHEVTVLTGYPNWPSGQVYPGYRIRARQVEDVGGVRVVRIPLYPDHSKSGLRRALNFLSFIVSASVLGPLFVRRHDIIHAIQPPTTCIPAWVLSRLWHVPFTYEVQDMWPETLSSTGMIGNRRVLRLVGRYCGWAYRCAAAVRVISPGFRADLVTKNVPPEKVRFIPNWVDAEFYNAGHPDAGEDAHDLQGKFVALYAGTVGLAQGLETLVDAAALLRQSNPNLVIVVAGDGLALEDLRRRAIERGATNVRFLGRIQMDRIPDLYARADAFILHLKDDPLFRMTIPHKTLTYLAAGKPIAAAVEGDVADVVMESGGGLTCKPADPEALARLLAAIESMPADVRDAMGERGRAAAGSTYDRDCQIGELEAMLTWALPSRRARGAENVQHSAGLQR